VALLDIGPPDERLRNGAVASIVLGQEHRPDAATGLGAKSRAQLAREAGFDDHLTKPIGFVTEALLQIEGLSRRAKRLSNSKVECG
jgi:CheY-like chemotaxis protein